MKSIQNTYGKLRFYIIISYNQSISPDNVRIGGRFDYGVVN